MSDKAKIRAEVERRYNERDKIGDNIRANVHKSLISFIDSMQEEPVSNPIDFEKELYKAFGQVKDFTLCMRIAKRFYDMGKKSREPVSENLEEAVNAYIGYAPEVDESSSTYGKRQAFKAGAQWQKEKDQSHLVHEHIDPPTFEEAQGEKKKED